MKKTNILLGLIILLFTASAATAQTLPICCGWNNVSQACGGFCAAGTECTQTGFQTCNCTPIVECVQEGDSYPVIPNGQTCCPGLTAISCSEPDQNGSCTDCTGAMICAYCGNGICGLGENICNCPQDCIEEDCEWVDNTCVGECESGGCIEIGYDYIKQEGICTCRDPNGCRYEQSIPNGQPPVFGFGECTGGCDTGICQDVDPSADRDECQCTQVPSVPEFATFTVGLMILLTTPAFAYLLIRKR